MYRYFRHGVTCMAAVVQTATVMYDMKYGGGCQTQTNVVNMLEDSENLSANRQVQH
jgi:hypothetical protein